MSILQDPEMKEIVDDFCDESSKQFTELEELLFDLEDDVTNTELLEKFGQTIDRVMGAAKSVGADTMGTLCELGKIIGYKSSQIKDEPLLNIVLAVLFDTVELLQKMLSQIQKGEVSEFSQMGTDAFVSRLRWLSKKFDHIERASVSVGQNKNVVEIKSDGNNTQSEIDSLLSDLGL